MPPHCFLVHGWDRKKKHGVGSVDELAKFVAKRGWEVDDFNWETNWKGLIPGAGIIHEEGRRLARMSIPSDAAIGHSVGASIVYLAMCYGAKFRRVILLNPTLDRDVKFPDCDVLEAIYIFYSTGDEIVGGAATIPFHIFGKMGKTGATRENPKTANIALFKDEPNSFFDFIKFWKDPNGIHTRLFDPDKVDAYGPIVTSCLPLV